MRRRPRDDLEVVQASDRLFRPRAYKLAEEHRVVHGQCRSTCEAFRERHLGLGCSRSTPTRQRQRAGCAARDQRHRHGGAERAVITEVPLVTNRRGKRLGVELAEDHRLPARSAALPAAASRWSAGRASASRAAGLLLGIHSHGDLDGWWRRRSGRRHAPVGQRRDGELRDADERRLPSREAASASPPRQESALRRRQPLWRLAWGLDVFACRSGIWSLMAMNETCCDLRTGRRTYPWLSRPHEELPGGVGHRRVQRPHGRRVQERHDGLPVRAKHREERGGRIATAVPAGRRPPRRYPPGVHQELSAEHEERLAPVSTNSVGSLSNATSWWRWTRVLGRCARREAGRRLCRLRPARGESFQWRSGEVVLAPTSAQGRCPAANAVASSRKKSSV
jgi:hypothetical protein